MEKVSFNYKGERIKVNVKDCRGIFKVMGLMFRGRQNAKTLLFDFKKPTKMRIHSFFVFFPFVAVWLDKNNKIVGLKKVEPFTFSVFPGKYYNKLLEIPVNRKYSNITKLLVGD